MQKEAIARLEADLLIVATGAVDYTRLLDGNHNIDIVSPHQIMRGRKLGRGKAIVVNEGRGQAGLTAAEVLLNGGMAVEIITTDIAVANDLDPTNRNAWYTRLGQKSCDFSAALSLVGAEEKSLRLRNVYDDRSYTRDDIDLIVDWPGCRANNELTGLRLDHEVHFIGDCVAPRNLEIAISEAFGLSSKVFN